MKKFYAAIIILFLAALVLGWHQSKWFGVSMVLSIGVIAITYKHFMTKTIGTLNIRMEFLFPLELLHSAAFNRDIKLFKKIVKEHREKILTIDPEINDLKRFKTLITTLKEINEKITFKALVVAENYVYDTYEILKDANANTWGKNEAELQKYLASIQ
ncbi:MAG: hypothetical protein AAB757_01560 [Patescibacteria group bacterium]